jgi:hypothetical protein
MLAWQQRHDSEQGYDDQTFPNPIDAPEALSPIGII